ncbi:hypothetical protein GCM10010124_39930 [Pilimelia terevasa]|uniref:DUF6879 domain-containing protein n=1 Tax=Pilimelia terevasa TaxID=53372 RepID=A0A8J3FJV2_9ACTN|nr:DUF6879 family protein [Pilimelia terevasa]GGK43098.1 hypothetical protein GCM10010124_39930 [Pilimelia terevasa]
MYQELSEDEFVAKLENVAHSRWRMEFQRYYASDTTQPRYQQWLADGTVDWAYYDEWIPYMEKLRAEGKIVRRIKVVDEPLNDYWRFTYAQVARLDAAGDSTRWLKRRDLVFDLFPANDFYILDGRELLYLHFDAELRPAGFSLVDDAELVEAATRSFARAWNMASPHHEYRP